MSEPTEAAPEAPDLTVTALASAAGISMGHASLILSGNKTPSIALACRIYRATGRKFAPIETASDDEIEVLERFNPDAAARRTSAETGAAA